MGNFFGDAGGGGHQGDEEWVETSEQGEPGVTSLLVVGADVSVSVSGGHSRASCWQRSLREMSLIVRCRRL